MQIVFLLGQGRWRGTSGGVGHAFAARIGMSARLKAIFQSVGWPDYFFPRHQIRHGNRGHALHECNTRGLWHIVPMAEKIKTPRNPYRPRLYFSPNTLDFYFTIPGETCAEFAKCSGPTPDETRQMIFELREITTWSRALLAGMLGVTNHTLRRWEDGTRNPSRAAKRLIWFFHTQLTDPRKLKDAFTVLTWGRFVD